jgi:hypothetical protein
MKNIPIVMYSTGCTYKEMNHALQLGAVNYVVKPPCYRTTMKAIRFFTNAYNLVGTTQD